MIFWYTLGVISYSNGRAVTDPVDADFLPFNDDASRRGGYVYTTNGRLSSQLANERLTRAVVSLADFKGKRVIDIGCGDGTYSVSLYDAGSPGSIHGIDPAPDAISVARRLAGSRNIVSSVSSAYALPFHEDAFDIAHIRGVLHHMDHPEQAIREAFRVAPTIVVIEPNGYNPVVKLLERFSAYHIEHGEKSYLPSCLNRWVRDCGANVVAHEWVGLVPFFCPDRLARPLKRLEPLIERLPWIRVFSCGVYAFAAQRPLSEKRTTRTGI